MPPKQRDFQLVAENSPSHLLIPAERLSPSSQKGAGRIHLFGAAAEVLMYLAGSGIREIQEEMAQSNGTATQ